MLDYGGLSLDKLKKGDIYLYEGLVYYEHLEIIDINDEYFIVYSFTDKKSCFLEYKYINNMIKVSELINILYGVENE